jgi:hypothetical protein
MAQSRTPSIGCSGRESQTLVTSPAPRLSRITDRGPSRRRHRTAAARSYALAKRELVFVAAHDAHDDHSLELSRPLANGDSRSPRALSQLADPASVATKTHPIAVLRVAALPSLPRRLQNTGARRRRSPPTARRHRHRHHCRLARPGAHRPHGLFFRARRSRHATTISKPTCTPGSTGAA